MNRHPQAWRGPHPGPQVARSVLLLRRCATLQHALDQAVEQAGRFGELPFAGFGGPAQLLPAPMVQRGPPFAYQGAGALVRRQNSKLACGGSCTADAGSKGPAPGYRAWERACTSVSRLDDEAAAAAWRPASQETVSWSYTHWLPYLSRTSSRAPVTCCASPAWWRASRRSAYRPSSPISATAVTVPSRSPPPSGTW